MHRSIVAAAAVAAVLAVAAPAGKAAAMPVATADQLGLAGSSAVEKTALICGPWGCYWRYWGWRRHYWWGWHRPGWGWGWRRPWGWRRW